MRRCAESPSDVEKNIAPGATRTSGGTSAAAAVKCPRNRRDEGVPRKRRSPLASEPPADKTSAPYGGSPYRHNPRLVSSGDRVQGVVVAVVGSANRPQSASSSSSGTIRVRQPFSGPSRRFTRTNRFGVSRVPPPRVVVDRFFFSNRFFRRNPPPPPPPPPPPVRPDKRRAGRSPPRG